MTKRLDYRAIAPEGMKAFYGVSAYVAKCGLPKHLVDLVYLRVSQVNGCAYCIDMHSRDLREQGLSVDKLVLVPVWREAAALFDEREPRCSSPRAPRTSRRRASRTPTTRPRSASSRRRSSSTSSWRSR
jgi:AhpD family alkylhydroperoxidase